jgi:epoxyqueuosine reductase
MSPGEISEIIKNHILAAGFDRCGLTGATELSHEKERLRRWLERGCHGEMDYLVRNFEKRTNASLLFEGAKSVAVALMSYSGADTPEGDSEVPVVSRYITSVDYHTVLKDRLHQALAAVKEELPDIRGRIFVDSAPVMEKALAVRAGLGRQGRNSLLIVPGGGSFYFIGTIVFNLEAEYDAPDLSDPCMSCRKCIDACPTGAISEEGFLNAARCISYLTVEKKREIPGEFMGELRNRLFGCDICQDVCPHNSNSAPCSVEELRRDGRLDSMTRQEWEELTPELFDNLFTGTTVERCGYDTFMRNVRFLKQR